MHLSIFLIPVFIEFIFDGSTQVQGFPSNNPRSSLTTIEQAPLQVCEKKKIKKMSFFCPFSRMKSSVQVFYFPPDPDPVGRQRHLEVRHHRLGKTDGAPASCMARDDDSHKVRQRQRQRQRQRLTEHRPLVWLGMTILTRRIVMFSSLFLYDILIAIRFEVPRTLGIEESVLQNWLTLIEANYRSGNTYHNSR